MSIASSGYDSWSRRKERQSRTENNHIQTRSKNRTELRIDTNHLHYAVYKNSQGYTELNLSKKLLTVVPQEVSYFSRLEVLNLSHNALDDLPSSLARIRTLKILNVANNLLTNLPETITNLTHLVQLDLTHNKLTSLPHNLGHLRVLQVLKLGQNHFETLPHDVGLLTLLKELDLHGNGLCYIPFTFQNLRKLKYLNMANNKYEHVPLPVCKIGSLRALNVRGNFLTSLTPDFEHLTNLKELNLSFNKFESVPTAILCLSELKYLNLAGNRLKHVSHHMTCLQSMQVLHIQENRISSFPDGFAQLQYLNISSNQLTSLSVINSRRLKYLNMKRNRLENMPAGVYNLTRLETLNLNSNSISSVSKDLVQLKKLKYLDLGNNVLPSFPPIADKLKKLDFFDLTGNNISDQVKPKDGRLGGTTHYQKSKSVKKQSNVPLRYSQQLHEIRQSMSSMVPKSSQKSTFSNSHDLDELLLNGFSKKLLTNNKGSVIIRKRPEMDEISENDSTFTMQRNWYTSDDTRSLFDANSRHSAVTSKTEDDFFGILNQLETFLNQDFRFDSNLSVTNRSQTGSLWDLTENRQGCNYLGMVLSRIESFSVTESGGNFISAVDSNVSLSFPPKAVSGTLHASLKVIKIEKEMLNNLREENNIITNILSIGPIIFLKGNKDTDFNHMINITIPAPKLKSHGHMILLSIREDNSCIPSSSGHRMRNGYITLNAWQLTGKVAVITQAKCKYKACKSMETLLQAIEDSVLA